VLLLTGIFLVSGITLVRPVLGNIEANSIAGRAGFKADDEIVAIDSHPVNSQRGHPARSAGCHQRHAPITLSVRAADGTCAPPPWIFRRPPSGCGSPNRRR
jgi:membrane-associated protease RseP (regulator of RpoE activity)